MKAPQLKGARGGSSYQSLAWESFVRDSHSRSSELWFRGFAGRGWRVITLTPLLTPHLASLACALHWQTPIRSKGVSECSPCRSASSAEQVGGERGPKGANEIYQAEIENCLLEFIKGL